MILSTDDEKRKAGGERLTSVSTLPTRSCAFRRLCVPLELTWQYASFIQKRKLCHTVWEVGMPTVELPGAGGGPSCHA